MVINFLKYRAIYFIVSGAFILLGIVFGLVNHYSGNGIFNYGVDFTGGDQFTINVGKAFDINDVSDIVKTVTGQQAPQVQRVSSQSQPYGCSIKVKPLTQQQRSDLTTQIINKYNLQNSAVTQHFVSGTVSNDLRTSAIWAVIISCLLMFLFISFRFRDFKIGISSIMALLHDVLVVIAFYAVARVELDYSFIAVLLTILGYSTIATIVIFDRLRENKHLLRNVTNQVLSNTSVTQTLRRSIFTSLTVLLSMLFVYILGVPSVRVFVLPLIFGVLAGTYSSICLSPSFWYSFTGERKAAAQVDLASRRQKIAPKSAGANVQKAAGAAAAKAEGAAESDWVAGEKAAETKAASVKKPASKKKKKRR